LLRYWVGACFALPGFAGGVGKQSSLLGIRVRGFSISQNSQSLKGLEELPTQPLT